MQGGQLHHDQLGAMALGQPSERETDSDVYAREMAAVAGKRWKRVLNVQAPYRWNVRRQVRGRVLEVGCGIGRNLLALPDSVGVDHNAGSVALARQAGLRAWTTDEWLRSEDAVEASYDTLLVAHVLEHVTAEVARDLLDTYVRYLKPSARLVLICPQEAGFRVDPVTHIRFVTGHELVQHAERLAFHEVSSTSFPFPRPVGKLFRYNEFVVIADRRSAPQQGK